MKERTSNITRRAGARRLSYVLALCSLILPGAAYAQKPRSPVSTYDPLIVSAAFRYQLDLHILRALVKQESGYQPCVVSPKGATGLMQLMPATAARFGVKNACNPAENIEGGARYLRWLLDYFGQDYTLALAGYNAGEGAVMKYGRRVPPYAETMHYVSVIQRTAMSYRVDGRYARPSGTPTPGVSPSPAPNEMPALSKMETGSTYFWN